MSTIDRADAAWAAFEARDRAPRRARSSSRCGRPASIAEPSCPARQPRRENVAFFADGDGGARRGLSRLPALHARRGRRATACAVAEAVAAIEAARTADAGRAGRAVGYAPHHFHRLFKRATGMTPAAYARGRRATRAADALTGRRA